MTLEVTETTQVHTIWFVGWRVGDMLAYVYKPEGEPWIAEYRFRYYTAPKVGDPFLENDKKRWYSLQNPGREDPPDNLVAAMTMATGLTKNYFNADVYDVIDVQGNGWDALRKMEKMPWCFAKTVPVSEVKNAGPGSPTN